MSFREGSPFHRAMPCMRVILKLIFNIRVSGFENLREWSGGILAANHRSYIDPPLIGMFVPLILRFMAKSELFRVPIIAPLIRYFNSFPIRRGGIDREALTIARECLLARQSLLIFPEGSRSNFTARPGIGRLAKETNCPILPVKLENTQYPLACILRRRKMQIIVGRPIDPALYMQFEDSKEGYRQLAGFILATIHEIQP